MGLEAGSPAKARQAKASGDRLLKFSPLQVTLRLELRSISHIPIEMVVLIIWANPPPTIEIYSVCTCAHFIILWAALFAQCRGGLDCRRWLQLP